MMRRMFASSFGCFSSLLGLRRLDKSLTQTMPARNSLSPSSTVERPQPNTSSAVRALPSNNASVTSAIACRRSGHATRFTSRPANSTAHSGICLFSNRDFFMCLALFLVAHENTYKWYVSNYVIPNSMAFVGINGSLFQGGNTGRLVHSLLDHSPLVKSLKRRGTALPLTGQVLFLLACAWTDAGAQSSPAPPVNSREPATSEKPKYLIFWSAPEKAGELAERVGMKGDGKTRLLGFGLRSEEHTS